jgi:hypothetical protein
MPVEVVFESSGRTQAGEHLISVDLLLFNDLLVAVQSSDVTLTTFDRVYVLFA